MEKIKRINKLKLLVHKEILFVIMTLTLILKLNLVEFLTRMIYFVRFRTIVLSVRP